MKEDIFEPLESKGFIGEFSRLILESIPTSQDWGEAIACAVESTVLAKVKVVTRIGPLGLNVWNLMIGPSGLAYKSTPILYYVYPVLSEVTEFIDRPVIMPGRFSVEGMIEYLGHNKDGKPMNNEGCIVRDEFTSLFKEVYNKSYLADELEFMSELYDGTLQKRYTRKTKLEQAKNVYVSLLAATTPYLFSVMERNFFLQGTGNRILYTIFEPQKPTLVDAETFFVVGAKQREKEELISGYAKTLSDIYLSNLRYVYPMPDAAKEWTKYKHQKDIESEQRFRANSQDVEYTYIQRLPEMALKLMALHTVSRSYKTIPRLKGDTLMASPYDVRWGIHKVERHYQHFKTMLERWMIAPKAKPVEIFERDLRYLLSFFKESEDKMLTQSELLQRSSMMKSDKFYRLISTLEDRKDIVALTNEEVSGLSKKTRERHGIEFGGKGRLPRVYRYAR